MKTLLNTVIVAAFGLFCMKITAQPLEQWSKNHQQASQALGEWVKAYPQAAHYLFEWDGNHPERSKEMVNWAITHPSENLHQFHAEHHDWPELDEFEKTHKAAMESFFVWCRNHKDAARELMNHPKALRWAGDHLYKQYLPMER